MVERQSNSSEYQSMVVCLFVCKVYGIKWPLFTKIKANFPRA